MVRRLLHLPNHLPMPKGMEERKLRIRERIAVQRKPKENPQGKTEERKIKKPVKAYKTCIRVEI